MKKILAITAIALVIIAVVYGVLDRRWIERKAAVAQPSPEAAVSQAIEPAPQAVDAPGTGTAASPAHASAPGVAHADSAAADTTHVDWVKIPGTGIPVFPKP